MSTLWTPSGEHHVGHPRAGDQSQGGGDPSKAAPGPAAGSGSTAPPGTLSSTGHAGVSDAGSTPEDLQRLEELASQLASTPAEVVIANHCFGLFELAGVYLSQPEPRLEQARLAIDALGAVTDTLAERLGDAEGTLRDALAQIRLAFVQIAGARHARGEETTGDDSSVDGNRSTGAGATRGS